jgi:hypothetical protein
MFDLPTRFYCSRAVSSAYSTMRHRESAPRCQFLAQGLPFQKLRNQVAHAVLLADVTNGKHTRMIQSAQDMRASSSNRRRRSASLEKTFGYDLDRDGAIKAYRVRGTPRPCRPRPAATGFRKDRVSCQRLQPCARNYSLYITLRADATTLGCCRPPGSYPETAWSSSAAISSKLTSEECPFESPSSGITSRLPVIQADHLRTEELFNKDRCRQFLRLIHPR